MASGPYLLGSSIPIEVTFDQSGLFVAATFYLWNGSAWIIQGSKVPMVNVASSNGYGCVFMPGSAGQYYVSKIAYTDGTYTTPNSDEPEGSDTFQVMMAPPAGTTIQLVGSLSGNISTPKLCGTISVPIQLQGKIEVPDELEGEI